MHAPEDRLNVGKHDVQLDVDPHYLHPAGQAWQSYAELKNVPLEHAEHFVESKHVAQLFCPFTHPSNVSHISHALNTINISIPRFLFQFTLIFSIQFYFIFSNCL